MDSWQKWSSIVTSGVIEGTVTRFFGKLPNALKMVDDFVNPMDDILRACARNGFQNAWSATSKLSGRAFSEVMEEGLIEIGNAASEALILGNDFDLSNLDDVAVSSLMLGGTMNGPSIMYNGIKQHYNTREIYGRHKAIQEELKRLDIEFGKLDPNIPGYNTKRQQLTEERQQQIEKINNLGSELELMAMVNGGKKTADLLVVGNEINALNKQAGVDPRLSPDMQDQRREEYISTLPEAERKIFKENYDAAIKAKDKLTKNIDFDNAIERVYGEQGKIIKSKLLKKDPNLKNLTKKEMAVAVHNEYKRQLHDNKANITRKAYNGAILEHVEKMVYNGKTFSESGRKNRRRKKENELLARYGDQLGVQSNNSSLILNKEENINAASVLQDAALEDLVLVDANTDEQLQKSVLNAQEEQKLKVFDEINRNRSLTPEQKEQQIAEQEALLDEETEVLLHELRMGETNGIIIGGKYITRDRKAAKAELQNGNLLAGTVLSHEISHAMDQKAFSGIGELVGYSKKLFDYMNQKFPEIHDNAFNLQR